MKRRTTMQDVQLDVDTVRNRVNRLRASHMSPPLKRSTALDFQARNLATLSVPSDYQEGYGANAGYFFLSSSTDVTTAALGLVDAWYNGLAHFDFSRPSDSGGRPENAQFTRTVWSATREFGLAALRNPAGGDKVWVVMTFAPRGNRPGKYAANVTPPGIDVSTRLEEVYSKTESDARYLREENLDAFLQDVRQSGIDAAETANAEVLTLLDDSYYKRHEVDRKVDVQVGDDITAVNDRLTNDYYEKTDVDAKDTEVRAYTDAEVNTLRDAVDVLDAYVQNDIFTRTETTDEIGTAVDALAADVYTKTAADTKFATEARVDALAASYLSRQQLDAVYSTIADNEALKAYTDTTFVTQAFADTELVTQAEQTDLVTQLKTVDFYVREDADQRYARNPDLDALETRIADSTYTKTQADDAFVARAELSGLAVQEDLDALDTAIRGDVYDKAEADARFVDDAQMISYTDTYVTDRIAALDVYDKTTSDTRFAPASLAATIRDDHYDAAESDSRFVATTRYVEYTSRVPERVVIMEESAVPPSDGVGSRRTLPFSFDSALSAELQETDPSTGEPLRKFYATLTVLCSDADNAVGMTATLISLTTTGAEVSVSTTKASGTWTTAGSPSVQLTLFVLPRSAFT